jgi:hypothetical protein
MSKLAIIEQLTSHRGLHPLTFAHGAPCIKNEPGITRQFEVSLPYDDDTKSFCTKFTKTTRPLMCIETDRPSHSYNRRLLARV